MNKFVYFMAVGLAFTVLQVATVEADAIPGTDCAATPGGPNAVAACWEAQAAGGGGDHPCSGMTGDALIKCTEENPPPSGDSVAGGPPTLTLNDPRCQLAEADRDPGCPVMAGMASGTGAGDGAVALTIGDPLCNLAPADRDPGCPNFGNADDGGGDGPALSIDDPRCIVAPEARHHRCPGFVAP